MTATVGLLTEVCGPHCGVKDGQAGHCRECHTQISHGNAVADGVLELEEGHWVTVWTTK